MKAKRLPSRQQLLEACAGANATLREDVSKFGVGPALYAGAREILHFHGEHVIDLRLGAREIRRLTADDLDGLVVGEKRRDWIELEVTSRAALRRLVALIVRATR